MYENRIAHLQEVHDSLDRRISAMVEHGSYDDVNLSNLKKEKLRIKDEIAKLTKMQWEHDHETIDYDDDER